MEQCMLHNDPEQFEPWFMENEVNGRIYPVVDDWCIGYMKAVMLRPEAWRVDEPEMVERLAPISLFSAPDAWSPMRSAGRPWLFSMMSATFRLNPLRYSLTFSSRICWLLVAVL